MSLRFASVDVESYSKLSAEELVERYDELASRLAGHCVELGEVKILKQWVYYQGYQQSHESSVGGRQHSGEVAAQDITSDLIRLESNIESCRVLISLVSDLLRHRAG